MRMRDWYDSYRVTLEKGAREARTLHRQAAAMGEEPTERERPADIIDRTLTISRAIALLIWQSCVLKSYIRVSREGSANAGAFGESGKGSPAGRGIEFPPATTPKTFSRSLEH